MKKTVLFALCAALTIILIGCGEEKEPETATVTAALSTTEAVEIYAGENLWDGESGEEAVTHLTNRRNNPGSVKFTILGILEDGQEKIVDDSAVEVTEGTSYETLAIGSAYDTIKITAQAVDTKGEYMLTYSYPAA